MSKQIGLKYQKLVEYRLLEKNFTISETLGDYSPYDLIVDTGKKLHRVQVRSTHWKSNKGNRGYKLLCTTWNRKKCFSKKECDFIISVTGMKNNCYVIPIKFIHQKTAFLHPDKDSYTTRCHFKSKTAMKWEKFFEAWDLLK